MTELTEPAQNQRSQDRVSTRRPAEIILNDQVFQALIINLSLEGVAILTATDLEIGDKIKIHFSLPGYEQSSTLILNGEVTHHTQVNQQHMFGVRFALLSLHEKLVITGFINFHHRLD